MNWLRNLRGRVRALFRKEQLDGAMAEEMRSHIEMQMQENIEAGMEAEEARFDALRRFGWTESIQEACREQRGVRWLETLVLISASVPGNSGRTPVSPPWLC